MATQATFSDFKRDEFLTHLRETANVSASAKHAGIARAAVYIRRKEDSEFSEAWDEAIEEAVDALEAEARRRAMEGEEREVYYQGECCGTIRHYPDQLLILLLKAHRPQKYAGVSTKLDKPEQNALIINITGGDDASPETEPAS